MWPVCRWIRGLIVGVRQPRPCVLLQLDAGTAAEHLKPSARLWVAVHSVPAMDSCDWVQALGTDRCLDAMTALVGSVKSSELREVAVDQETFAALVEGLSDPNPRIRWWCVQLLDHISDERTFEALVPALDDPVPRVRRNAAHALGCRTCKPSWDGSLSVLAVERLRSLADTDPNAKVRAEAFRALACSGRAERGRLLARLSSEGSSRRPLGQPSDMMRAMTADFPPV